MTRPPVAQLRAQEVRHAAVDGRVDGRLQAPDLAVLRAPELGLPAIARVPAQTELAVGAVEKGSAISTPLLALLRATDPAGFAEKLTDKAMRLKRAQEFKEAFSLFRRLDEASMLGEDEARYAALVSGLCATDAKKDLGRATRTTDPILRQAVELVTVGYPVARKLKKDRTLTPEDLFFVGFNFAESQDEDEREFGGELLSHLAETSPRSKLGKSAKNKLRLVGIA